MACHHPSIANLLEKLRRERHRHDGVYLVGCKQCGEDLAVDFLRLELTDAEPTQEGVFRPR